MRTYILALTKYALTAVVVIYTVLSFILLVSKKRNVHSVLAYLQSVLMLVFQLIAYVTLSVAMNDPTYIFFSIVQLVTFFIATALFRNLYRKAYLPLFNNMCFLLSIGLVIISRLSFSSAWRQFVIAVGGLAIAIILPLFRRYFHLLKLPKFYWGLAGIVILSVVMLLGSSTLGANITWSIGGLTFQPSEFVKILYLLFLACTLKDVKTLKDISLKDAADPYTMAAYALSEEVSFITADPEAAKAVAEALKAVRKDMTVEQYTECLEKADFPLKKGSDGKTVTWPASFSYESEGTLYYSVPVPHALGDYIIVEYDITTK